MERWHIALLEPRAFGLTRDDHGEWASNTQRILRNRGYEVCYPGLPAKFTRGQGAVEMKMRPMFPGYLFVNEPAQGWELLRTTPGVRTFHSLLMINGRYAVLPIGEIYRINARAEELIDQILNPPPRELPFGIGDTVKVIDGAFSGWLAKIETLDDDERIALLMDIFGRQTRVYASWSQLAAT